MSDATMERMTAAEIRESYAAAKYPEEQIKILAELNLCKKQDIRDIIEGKTDELPPPAGKRKRRDPHTYYISTAKRKEIIERHAAGETVEELAAAYSATVELIQQILDGTYKQNKPKTAKAPEGGPPAEPDAPVADPDDDPTVFVPAGEDHPAPDNLEWGFPQNPPRTILEIAAEAFTETDRRYRDAEYLEIKKHGDRLTVEVANDEVTVVIYKSPKPKEREDSDK